MPAVADTWAGIVRVSHVGTRSGESFHADEEQVAEIRRYAARHGAEVVFMQPELSISGGRPIEERPALVEAIEGVEQGRFTGIVVAYLSRLTRSRSGITIWDRVERAGGSVHCAAENLDTSTANGRFIRDIHLANAVREREEHADRHARRRQKTVEAGVWRMRQVPRGYRFQGPADASGRVRGTARRLVPGPDADEVRRAFRDRALGVPVVVIADRLGMTASGVRAMLRNRVYLGELRDGENVKVGAHEPLVTVEEFEAVQGQPRPARSAGGGVALLAGLVRCRACGHVMTRSGPGDKRTYVCGGRNSAGRCPAPAGVTAGRLERYVTAVALGELDRLAVQSVEADTGAEDAQARLVEAERELSAYVSAVSVADVGAEAFAAGARVRRDAVEEARAEVRRRVSVRPAAPVIGSAVEVWDALDGHRRNALLRALFEVVIVQRAGGRGARVPLTDRVRVIAHGAGLPLVTRGAGRAAGVCPLPWLDVDDERVVGVLGAEEAF